MLIDRKPESLSAQDFAALGLNDLAFVKPVLVEGKTVYAIHAADGTAMALVEEKDIAEAAIRQHDLEPLAVH